MGRHRCAGVRADRCEDCGRHGRIGRRLLVVEETRRLRCIDQAGCRRRITPGGTGPEPMAMTLASRLAGELP